MDSLYSSLLCIKCRAGLSEKDNGLFCGSCGAPYPKRGEAIFFRNVEERDGLKSAAESGMEDSFIVRLKNLVKKNPKWFMFLNRITCAVVGKTALEIVTELPEDSLVINIGSGVKVIHPKVVNVDYDALPGVRLAADIHYLPFKNGSVDLVIAESVLEHALRPEKVVEEIRRVLRPGGIAYIVVPFMLGYHSSPRDYYRWTHHGLAELFEGFSEESHGPFWGPTGAVVSILGGWLALVLSFGSAKLYQFWTVFFMFVLAPLTLLDFLIARHKLAEHISHGLYFIARKN